MTPRREITSSSSCPLKKRFALKFLKTLVRIKKSKLLPSSPSSPSEMCRRTRRIKLAAYSSMAQAVGSRRAWSRALLLRLRAKGKARRSLSARTNRWRCLGMKQKGLKKVSRRMVAKKKRSEEGSSSGVDELRRLVPGGESMDLSVLLEETAHFVWCLETQVRVMKCIADGFPCRNTN